MNPPEHDIEKVLTALQNSPVPDGMERRILASLQDRAASASPHRHTLIPAWLKIATGLSLATAAVLVIVLTSTPRRASETPAPNLSVMTPASPQPQPAPIASTPIATSRPHPSQPRRRTAHTIRTPKTAELHSVSYPAPPMPLTGQERLLLRIAHHRAPFELAALSPVRKAEQDEQDKAAFEKFFEPPKMENPDADKP